MEVDYEREARRRARVEQMITEFRDAQSRRSARPRPQRVQGGGVEDEQTLQHSRQAGSTFRFVLRNANED